MKSSVRFLVLGAFAAVCLRSSPVSAAGPAFSEDQVVSIGGILREVAPTLGATALVCISEAKTFEADAKCLSAFFAKQAGPRMAWQSFLRASDRCQKLAAQEKECDHADDKAWTSFVEAVKTAEETYRTQRVAALKASIAGAGAKDTDYRTCRKAKARACAEQLAARAGLAAKFPELGPTTRALRVKDFSSRSVEDDGLGGGAILLSDWESDPSAHKTIGAKVTIFRLTGAETLDIFDARLYPSSFTMRSDR